MVSSIYWEWDFLMHTIKLGVKLAFIYDGILIFRLICPHKNMMVSIEDLIYWMYAAIIIFQLLLEQSDGVLRGFSILGIALGMLVYNKLFGERIVTLAGKWIGFVKRRLTTVRKMLKIKLCKHKDVSKISRREHGKKKNSSKKKETKQLSHDTGINGSSDLNAGSGSEQS